MAIQEEKYMRQEQMEDMKRSWNQSKNDKGKNYSAISLALRDTYGFLFYSKKRHNISSTFFKLVIQSFFFITLLEY